jgi:hypothetical protein
MDYVKLKNEQGGFHDPESGLSLSRDDCVPLKEPIGKLTRERLATGALIRCKPPVKARQEVCQETEGPVDATLSDPATMAPDLGNSTGQAAAETDGAAALGAVEKAAPAPIKKRATRKKAR